MISKTSFSHSMLYENRLTNTLPEEEWVKLKVKIKKIGKDKKILDLSSCTETQDRLLSIRFTVLKDLIQEQLENSTSRRRDSCCARIQKWIISFFYSRRSEQNSSCPTAMAIISKWHFYEQFILCKVMPKYMSKLQEHPSNLKSRERNRDAVFQEICAILPPWIELFLLFSQVDESLFKAVTIAYRDQLFTLTQATGFLKVYQKYCLPILLLAYEEGIKNIYEEVCKSLKKNHNPADSYVPEIFLEYINNFGQDLLIPIFDKISRLTLMQETKNQLCLLEGLAATDLPFLKELINTGARSFFLNKLLLKPHFLEILLKTYPQLPHQLTASEYQT